jgi:hypothetical protein
MLWPSPPSPKDPNIPSDWWYTDTNIKIVNGTGDLWSGDRIPFFTDHGYGTWGASMKLARLEVGMAHPHMPLSQWAHYILLEFPHPMLSIQVRPQLHL